MTGPAPIVFEETVSYLLAKVTTAYRNAIERHLGEIDLHSGQTFVLIELWAEDGLRPVDLAHRLNVKPPTVSNMLKGLDKINLIKMKKTDGDGRSVRVFLTGRGKLIRSEVERRWIDVEAECVGSLTPTDRYVMMDLLRKLHSTYTGQKFEVEE